jgi:hypothetical protein
MAKITGIRGVFFASGGVSSSLAAWYSKHLGMPLEDFGGAILRWRDDIGRRSGSSTSTSCWRGSVRVGGVDITGGPESVRTASLRGSWIRTESRSSSANRRYGRTGTQA